MSATVECTECEFSGTEDDLHYVKAKPWSASEDGVCPNCGSPVALESTIEINEATLLKECEGCPHCVCHLGKQCPEPLHVMDNKRKMIINVQIKGGGK